MDALPHTNPLAFYRTQGKKKRLVPVELPDLQGATLVDTHAHVTMLADPALALARAAVAGLTRVMTIHDVFEDGTSTYDHLEAWRVHAQELLDEYAPALTAPQVGIIVGVHPHHARHFNDDLAAAIRAYARDPRTVGLGELGLDYHYDHSPREVQRSVFARQLALAHELELPVTIHLREAHADGLALLRQAGLPQRGAILHCFNLDAATAAPFLELGCVVSFAGPVTFKKSDDVRAAAAAIPAGRVMVETDCPFMAPEPFRGQLCEPAYTLWNAATVAVARGISLSDCARETTTCAQEVFAW